MNSSPRMRWRWPPRTRQPGSLTNGKGRAPPPEALRCTEEDRKRFGLPAPIADRTRYVASLDEEVLQQEWNVYRTAILPLPHFQARRRARIEQIIAARRAWREGYENGKPDFGLAKPSSRSSAPPTRTPRRTGQRDRRRIAARAAARIFLGVLRMRRGIGAEKNFGLPPVAAASSASRCRSRFSIGRQ